MSIGGPRIGDLESREADAGPGSGGAGSRYLASRRTVRALSCWLRLLWRVRSPRSRARARPVPRGGTPVRTRVRVVSARRRLTDWTKTRDRDLKTKTVIGPAMRCMHRACRGAPTPGPRAREYHDCVTTAIGRTCRTSHSPHTCHVPRGLAVLQLRRLAPRPGRRGASAQGALPYKVYELRLYSCI